MEGMEIQCPEVSSTAAARGECWRGLQSSTGAVLEQGVEECGRAGGP